MTFFKSSWFLNPGCFVIPDWDCFLFIHYLFENIVAEMLLTSIYFEASLPKKFEITLCWKNNLLSAAFQLFSIAPSVQYFLYMQYTLRNILYCATQDTYAYVHLTCTYCHENNYRKHLSTLGFFPDYIASSNKTKATH